MVRQNASILIVSKSELKKVLHETHEDILILREGDRCKVIKDRTGYFVCNTNQIRR
jgi:PHD/YefM family antitoxin component YafN of YafNO toxin-antitoxin module